MISNKITVKLLTTWKSKIQNKNYQEFPTNNLTLRSAVQWYGS